MRDKVQKRGLLDVRDAGEMFFSMVDAPKEQREQLKREYIINSKFVYATEMEGRNKTFLFGLFADKKDGTLRYIVMDKMTGEIKQQHADLPPEMQDDIPHLLADVRNALMPETVKLVRVAEQVGGKFTPPAKQPEQPQQRGSQRPPPAQEGE